MYVTRPMKIYPILVDLMDIILPMYLLNFS